VLIQFTCSMSNDAAKPPDNAGPPAGLPTKTIVNSLLDHMVDGREFASLLDVAPQNLNLSAEIRRGILEVEMLRQRPLLCYVSNVLRAGEPLTPLELADDLPFSEMVAAVPASAQAVDVFVVTPGGSAQQANSFVQKLRTRFSDVAFLVPHMCMSAGTILVTSGNDIVMDERGFLGPIDPQVPNRDGRFVPAQALFALVAKLQESGRIAIQKGQNPEWTDVQLLRLLDPKELGNAIGATEYAVQLVREYLEKYKFSNWVEHSSDGRAVTAEDRKKRADEVARKLGSHDEWRAHSHGIFRDVLWERCRIKITHPDAALVRAMRRLWTVYYWAFENTPIQKAIVSSNYSIFKAHQINRIK